MKNNLEEMEKYLSNENPKFIFYENELFYEDFLKLKDMYSKYNKTKFANCFENCNLYPQLKFKIELKCECGEKHFVEVSKTKLMRYMRYNTNFKCAKCEFKESQEKKKNEKKRIKMAKQKIERDKETYKNLYLNPEASFPEGSIAKDCYAIKMNIEYYLKLFKKDELKDYIDENLTYQEYLATPYWQFISYYFKNNNNFKCSLCGKQGTLNLHHNTYKNKGKELLNSKDVIVICNECHKKFHEIEED